MHAQIIVLALIYISFSVSINCTKEMKTISTTKCFLTKFILIITHEQITKAKNGSNRYKQKIDKNNHEQKNDSHQSTLSAV